MQLDLFDKSILAILQDDCQQSHAQLGEAVGLSGSAVRRRIKAMRDSGVIAREVAILGDGWQGAGITVIVTVAFQQESRKAYDSFRKLMRSDPHVLQCYATAGQFDFILVVTAASPEDYERWGEETLMSNAALRRYDSYVAFSTVKFDTKRSI